VKIQTPATILIMAGGTGGHVYPALAVAEYLRDCGYGVQWLGTQKGLEARVVPVRHFPIEFITSVGVRGKGLWNGLLAPFTLAKGLWEAIAVLRNVKPVAVLGMGGFVSVPGGIASWLMRKPLVIHEQNAVAGSANRLLNHLAKHSLQGFEGALPGAELVGNPVRKEIAALHQQPRSFAQGRAIHLLVLGGSLGAKAINDVLPAMIKQLPPEISLHIWHQTGEKTYTSTLALYEKLDLTIDGDRIRVSAYIEEMATAYRWADVMLCRAGAMTLAELTCAGLPALLVPLPNAIDDHQRKNAEYLVERGAALLLAQDKLTAGFLLETLTVLMRDVSRLQAMTRASQQVAQVNATRKVAEQCLQSAGISLSAEGVNYG
jgi:UDP-N-acetylglucosamine--N-acetylmuramyl-(pentapeptide) pyrophosphoryl-undecaprenol N-acetylglucosamine transferase